MEPPHHPRWRPGRPRSRNGRGKKARQHKRTNEPYHIKLAVINHLREHGDMPRTLAKFFAGLEGKRRETKRKSIYDWVRDRAKIEASCLTAAGGELRRVRALGTATALPRVGEEQVVLWIKALRGDGVPVSAYMLQTKAIEVAATYDIDPAFFKASWTFHDGFLRRHELSLRQCTRQGQKTPEGTAAAVAAARVKVLELMLAHNTDRLFNADQTAVMFEYIPKQTVAPRGVRTVWVRCGGREKARVTAMLLGDSLGTKYTPFIIAKMKPSTDAAMVQENKMQRQGFCVHVWKEASALQQQHDVVLYGNPLGWWNAELSVAFLKHHFGSRHDMGQAVLLLWDDLSAHWTTDVLSCAKELNVVLVPVPPGCTCVCQPADISWNKPLKSCLRAQWIDNLQAQLRRPRADGERFKLVPPKRKDAVVWAMEAWSALSPAIIKSGFSFVFKDQEDRASRRSDVEPEAKLETEPENEPAAEPEVEPAGEAMATATAVAELLGRLDLPDQEVGEVRAEHDMILSFLDSSIGEA